MLGVLSVLLFTCLLDFWGTDFTIKVGRFKGFGRAVMVKVKIDKKVKPFNHIRGACPIVNKDPWFMLDPDCKATDGFLLEWAHITAGWYSFSWVSGAGLGFSKCNVMVRRGCCCCVVRLDCCYYDRLQVVLANVSNKNIKNGVCIGWFGDYLPEARVDVKEQLDVQVILVSSTDEGWVRILGFQVVVIQAYVLYMGWLFLAVRWEVEGANNNTFNVTIWQLRIEETSAHLQGMVTSHHWDIELG
jgi:hypothetical protein